MVEVGPELSSVIEGGSAILTCTVTGRDQTKSEVEWQGISKKNTTWEWAYRANLNASFDFRNYANFDSYEYLTPGTYSTVYSVNETSDEEVFQLCINNVTKQDSEFDFFCSYSLKNLSKEPLQGKGELIVWSRPQCSFHSDGPVPPVIYPPKQVPINLTCAFIEDNISSNLTWYTADMNGRLKEIVGQSATTKLIISHDLTSADKGREFICKAVIESDDLPKDPLTCSLVPYNPESTTTNEPYNIFTTYPASEEKSMFIIIIATTSGGCSMIVILILSIWCVSKKCKPARKETEKDGVGKLAVEEQLELSDVILQNAGENNLGQVNSTPNEGNVTYEEISSTFK